MMRPLTRSFAIWRFHLPPYRRFAEACYEAKFYRMGNRHSSTASVDPQEVRHFNALASSWWDPHGPSRLLHLMNPLRLSFIHSCLHSQRSPPPARPLRYLDVGCGGGIFAESAARLATTGNVTAIDPTPAVLAVAQEHARRDPLLMTTDRLNYRCIAIEDLAPPAAPSEGVDVLTLFEVLEHVADAGQFLELLLPHVRPGGWIILSTIAQTWTSWVTTKLLAEDLLRIVPRGTHDWAKYINEAEVRKWFASKPGWESARAMGVMFVPGLGWREVPGGEALGNYFFGIRKCEV